MKFDTFTAAPQLVALTSNVTSDRVFTDDTVIITANFSTSMAASPVIIISSDDANTTNFPMQSYGFGIEALDAFNTTNSAIGR